jgi:hypothetical protein
MAVWILGIAEKAEDHCPMPSRTTYMGEYVFIRAFSQSPLYHQKD